MPSGGMEPAVEAVIEAPIVAPAMPQARLSDRNVDLPIEVAEDERRSHNDARRFARLLVSEIKLYNEKKVTEGRDANDLYERLREAIDRSREMYDKRVQPPVAAKFDYFHYELVNSLAEGEANRLGNGYPGATI
jgi:nickel-dependent lactate racemase